MTNSISFLPDLETAAIGAPITRAGVSLFPVYLPGRPGPTSSIATGPDAEVEISEQPNASVPSLRATNRSERPVLLVEGQVVRGGQQDRVLNVSIVVPAGQSIDIPVSCVERGRWSHGRSFDRVGVYATRRVRRAKTESVGHALRARGDRYSDQGAVWQTVDFELARLGVQHDSASFAAVERAARPEADPGDRPGVIDEESRFEEIRRAVGELSACGPLPGQCGLVVAHGSRVVSLECFASPDLLAAHWAALVGSIMLDAPEGRVSRPSATKALAFVRRVASRRADSAPGVGLGTERHIQSKSIAGQAVVVDDCLLHASAFALAA